MFGETHISIPCTCEDGGRPLHWAAIANDLEAIEDHFGHEALLAELRRMEAQSADPKTNAQ